MNETHLTMMQRNKINYFLRNGSALPQPEMPTRKLPAEEYEMQRAREIMDRSRKVRRRPLDTILKSGVFEMERWIESDEKQEKKSHEYFGKTLRFQELSWKGKILSIFPIFRSPSKFFAYHSRDFFAFNTFFYIHNTFWVLFFSIPLTSQISLLFL